MNLSALHLPADDLAEDRAGEEKGDVPVGETSPTAHEENERNDQVNGQPPFYRKLHALRPPRPKGQCRYESYG